MIKNLPFSSEMTNPSFSKVLDYEGHHIVCKFLEKYEMSFDEAKALFEETKKWLWLCAVVSQERKQGMDVPLLSIDEPMTMLDEMWHTFILFTKEYHDFCMDKFGFFIHHAPTTKAEKEAAQKLWEENPEAARTAREAQLEAQYSYIYDKLGEETLVKWYSEWSDKYTPEYIQSITKK